MEVAECAKRRMTVRETAAKLGIGKNTVMRDLIVLRERWLEQQSIPTDELVRADLRALDNMEGKLTDQFEALYQVEAALLQGVRSLQRGRKYSKSSLQQVAHATIKAKLSLGIVAAAILKTQERRSKLLGMDAPVKVDARVEAHVTIERTELNEIMAKPRAQELAHALALELYAPKATDAPPNDPAPAQAPPATNGTAHAPTNGTNGNGHPPEPPAALTGAKP